MSCHHGNKWFVNVNDIAKSKNISRSKITGQSWSVHPDRTTKRETFKVNDKIFKFQRLISKDSPVIFGWLIYKALEVKEKMLIVSTKWRKAWKYKNYKNSSRFTWCNCWFKEACFLWIWIDSGNFYWRRDPQHGNNQLNITFDNLENSADVWKCERLIASVKKMPGSFADVIFITVCTCKPLTTRERSRTGIATFTLDMFDI